MSSPISPRQKPPFPLPAGPAAVSFGVAYWLLLISGPLPWHVATGLLFLALWLAPRRAWPWFVLAALLARWAHHAVIAAGVVPWVGVPSPGAAGLAVLAGRLLEPLLVAGAVHWLRRRFAGPESLGSLAGMVRFVLAALLASVLAAGLAAAAAATPALSALLDNVQGGFVGCLLVVPLGAWLARQRFHAGSGRILGEVLLFTLALVAMLLLARGRPDVAEWLRLAALVGVAVFGTRHGWRGASASLLVAGTLAAFGSHPGLAGTAAAALPSALALVGALALMLGASIDGSTRQADELDAGRRRQTGLAEELHDAAMRNLTVEERERQRLAVELHDEFGQNLAALQTHLKLSRPAMEAAGSKDVVDRLLELTRQMQHNIGRVLDSLRPAALDELGLFGAIDRGSLRRLAEDAGLAFETRLEGDARLLSRLTPAHRVAAYRIAQGAVTNVVRHANARHCWLRLRASARGGQLWLFLDVRDDGEGRLANIRPGNGLNGLQDRVLGLGGRLAISQRRPGLRVHVLLRQPLPG